MTSRWRSLRPVGDGLAAVAALGAAFLVRLQVPLPFTRGLLPGDRLRLLSQEWLVVLLLQFAALYFFGFYDAPRPRGRIELLRRLGTASAFQAMALMAYWVLANREFPRSVLLLFVAFDFLLLFGWRLLLDGRRRLAHRIEQGKCAIVAPYKIMAFELQRDVIVRSASAASYGYKMHRSQWKFMKSRPQHIACFSIIHQRNLVCNVHNRCGRHLAVQSSFQRSAIMILQAEISRKRDDCHPW